MDKVEAVGIVGWHVPELTVHYDVWGGVDIKLDNFLYVHINYDYRYTDNASRKWLADQIVALLRPPPTASGNDEERSV